MCENFKNSFVENVIKYVECDYMIPIRFFKIRNIQTLIFTLTKYDETSPYIEYEPLFDAKLSDPFDERYSKTSNSNYIYDKLRNSKICLRKIFWDICAETNIDTVYPSNIFGDFDIDIKIIYEDTFSKNMMEYLEKENAISEKKLIKSEALKYKTFFENKVMKNHEECNRHHEEIKQLQEKLSRENVNKK